MGNRNCDNIHQRVRINFLIVMQINPFLNLNNMMIIFLLFLKNNIFFSVLSKTLSQSIISYRNVLINLFLAVCYRHSSFNHLITFTFLPRYDIFIYGFNNSIQLSHFTLIFFVKINQQQPNIQSIRAFQYQSSYIPIQLQDLLFHILFIFLCIVCYFFYTHSQHSKKF